MRRAFAIIASVLTLAVVTAACGNDYNTTSTTTTTVTPQGGTAPPPIDAEDPCKGIDFVGPAPDVEGIAFGSSAIGRIPNFFTETVEERNAAVVRDQVSEWCKFPAIAYANAGDFGVRPETTTDDQWVTGYSPLNTDREAHIALVKEMVVKINSATSVYVEEQTGVYFSKWFERTGYGPLLRSGPGHAAAGPGWVIRYVFADGTEVVFRLTCDYQTVRRGSPPPQPPVTTTPPPPTTQPPGTTPTTAPPTTQPPTTVPPGTTTTTVPCDGVLKAGVCEHPPASPTIPPAPSTTVHTTIAPSATTAPDPVPTGAPVHTVDPPVSTNPTSVGGNTGSSIPATPPSTPVTPPPATIPQGTVVSD